MKTFAFGAVAASLLLGVCAFVTGCNQSSVGSDKKGMSDGKMSAMDKMADDKMAGEKMDAMSGSKISDGKMSGK